MASAIGESIQGEKRQCDVRKIIEEKKIIVVGCSRSRSPTRSPIPEGVRGGGGGVAKL